MLHFAIFSIVHSYIQCKFRQILAQLATSCVNNLLPYPSYIHNVNVPTLPQNTLTPRSYAMFLHKSGEFQRILLNADKYR